jgi:hypothetical protein
MRWLRRGTAGKSCFDRTPTAAAKGNGVFRPSALDLKGGTILLVSWECSQPWAPNRPPPNMGILFLTNRTIFCILNSPQSEFLSILVKNPAHRAGFQNPNSLNQKPRSRIKFGMTKHKRRPCCQTSEPWTDEDQACFSMVSRFFCL